MFSSTVKVCNVVYLPIEIRVRELDSRILLACYLVNAGFDVILCTRSYCNDLDGEKPRGIVLAKSIAEFEFPVIRNHKEHGNIYTCQDIEGVLNLTTLDQKFRFSQETIDETDLIFLNSKKEFNNLVANHFSLDNQKFVMTGPLQFDLYKGNFWKSYVIDSEGIQREYGNYILIISRFGDVNNRYKDDNITWSVFYNEILKLGLPEDLLKFYSDFAEHSSIIFNEFIELLPQLANSFPELNFVIRPHPNERPEGWLNNLEGIENVFVVFEGPILPWIIGSLGVIHNGCTTGIETALLNKPLISFMSQYSDNLDESTLSNRLGLKCYSITDVIDSINLILNGSFSNRESFELLSNSFENINSSACELIVKEYKKLCNDKTVQSVKFYWVANKWRIFKSIIKGGTKNSKFPLTKKSYISSRISFFVKESPDLDVECLVKEIDYNCFLITKK